MSLALDFTLGNVITLIAMAVGVIGGYVTLRITSTETAKRTDALTLKIEAAERSLNDHRLEVSREYVRRNDLREVKEELVASIREIQGTVREAISNAFSNRRHGGTP
ncbi:MAG: hypothetical protein K2X54_09495 [Methylobacterium organophilum]|nr:hypothetical protein [Methylobacterium organophilum]